VLARVAENSTFAIGSALDAGVDGVLVPMVETAEQAEAAVAAARFPPRGIRSGGGVRPLAMGFPNYLAQADDLFVGIMVETVTGAANAARIAATAGLDMIFIGSGDLMLSCAANGLSGDVDGICQSIKVVSHAAGVPCGMFTADAEAARRARRNGFRMVVTANDIDLVTKGWNSAWREWSRADGD
jgi:2-keto-3-deoxy-L-rhamnonate aldolase RhmA